MPNHILASALGPLFLLLLSLSPLSLAQQRASVLVIESYHASYPWEAGYLRALQEVLSEKVDLQFFEMDTKRRPQADYAQRADLAWQVYLRSPPDLVILGDDNALKYLGPRLAETDTPVVYLGINNNPRNYFTALPKNMTGVLERPLLKRSIVYMHKIMAGKLDKVLVLFDAGITAKVVIDEQFSGGLQQSLGSIDVHIRSIGDLDQWREAIIRAPGQGYDAIVVGLYHTLTTRDGEHVPEQQIITWSSANTTIPLFAFWSFAVGEEMTIGGLVVDGYAQGKLAAAMVLQVLAGESISAMPRIAGSGDFVFSRSQLAKWGINLPDDIAEVSTFVP